MYTLPTAQAATCRICILSVVLEQQPATFKEDNLAEVTIKIQKNGPYVITGPVRVLDFAGKEYTLGDEQITALCRCGNSKNRPFCDGQHKSCAFKSEEVAR